MDEVRQTIGQILDGFCENRADADLLPAVDLLKACYEQLPTGPQTDFFRVLAERLQSEPISFPRSASVKRSSHILIIRAWAAFGPTDDLPRLLFSMLRPDTPESAESWANMIGTELQMSLVAYGSRFSPTALERIKRECALITYDREIELTDSRFPHALIEVAQRLENLVKDIEFKRNVVQKLRPHPSAGRPALPQQHGTRKVATDTAPSELWEKFDQSLFELKLREPSRKMHEQTESRWRKVQFERRKNGQGEGIGLFLALADSDLAALLEFLEQDIDRICRDVWRAQGNSITPDFVRTILAKTVLNTMEVRLASITWGIEEIAKRQRSSEDLFPVRTHLVQATNQLKSDLSNRYEIEARELEYKNAPPTFSAADTKGNGHEPIATSPEWRDLRDRFMQLAHEEQGRTDVITAGNVLRRMDQLLRVSCCYKEHPEGWERGKPEQGMICLLDTPPHGVWNYCNDGISENFRERVRLCVAEAGRGLTDYPRGADAEDFWLHRLYLDLLKNNSDQLFAASKDGGMILSVCVASATFCARLEREALQQSKPDVERLGTGANQAESSLAQNSGKTTQHVVDGRPAADGAKVRIGRNIEKLRKECGWSLDKLADKTGIDKKAILSHVHGRSKPNPRTQKEYAQAFAKELNRPITANNLEE